MNAVFKMYDETIDDKANACQFAVFVVKLLADHWGISEEKCYEVLQEHDLIDNYIIANFSVLHTQGDKYLIYDVEKVIKEDE